jgi:uncharacterized membrane protein
MPMAGRFKSYFLRGLAVLLPTTLTIGIFVWGYTFIQEKISIHINRGLVHVIALATNERVEISDSEVKEYLLETKKELKGKPGELEIHAKRPEVQKAVRVRKLKGTLAETMIDGPGSVAGFLIALIAVCSLGALLASYVGRSLWRMTENYIMITPVLRRVYPYVKQVTDFFLTEEEQRSMFRRVVAVEYPRKGIWSVGFVTGTGLDRVVSVVKREFVTVLIPTSPTPFTGFVITVQRRQTIDLDMTIEEALRFIVSGGVITPARGRATFAEPEPVSEDKSS